MTIGELKAILMQWPDETLIQIEGFVCTKPIEEVFIVDDELRANLPSYQDDPDCVVIS